MVHDSDIWGLNGAYAVYAVLAKVVERVATSDVFDVVLTTVTILGGLSLAWFNIERALKTRKERRGTKRDEEGS